MDSKASPELSYTCGTADFPLLGQTIGEILNEIAEKYPDIEAIVSPQQEIRLTYRQFREAVDQVARGLMALDIN